MEDKEIQCWNLYVPNNNPFKEPHEVAHLSLGTSSIINCLLKHF